MSTSGQDDEAFQKCLDHWTTAFKRRYGATGDADDHKNGIIPKAQVHDAITSQMLFPQRQEATTQAELDVLVNNREHCMFEAILIQERLLGPNVMLHPDNTAAFLRAQGDSCMEEREDYAKGIEFWLKAIDVRRRADSSVSDDVSRLAGVLETMEEKGYRVREPLLWRILRTSVEELEAESYRLTLCQHVTQIRTTQKHINDNTYFTLFMLYKLVKVAQHSEEKTARLHQLVRKLLGLSLVTKTGDTLLHVCCSDVSEAQVTNRFIRHAVPFPNVTLVELLLECGSDVDALNYNGDNALHALGLCDDSDPARRDDMRQIARHLLTYGTHIDLRNRDGWTPQDVANLTIGYYLKPEYKRLPLKCLAAQTVKLFVNNYDACLPKILVQFVKRH